MTLEKHTPTLAISDKHGRRVPLLPSAAEERFRETDWALGSRGVQRMGQEALSSRSLPLIHGLS